MTNDRMNLPPFTSPLNFLVFSLLLHFASDFGFIASDFAFHGEARTICIYLVLVICFLMLFSRVIAGLPIFG